MDLTLQQIIQKLPEYFLPTRSVGINMTAQLNLKGDPMDYWTLIIENQHCQILHKKTPDPQIELTAAPADLLDILSGKLEGMRAYMQGKLHLRGSLLQTAKLLELFRIPDDLAGKIRY